MAFILMKTIKSWSKDEKFSRIDPTKTYKILQKPTKTYKETYKNLQKPTKKPTKTYKKIGSSIFHVGFCRFSKTRQNPTKTYKNVGFFVGVGLRL